jgi:hypothetical protein
MENTSKKVSGTVIVVCDCTNNFQDATYGRNKRVANYKGSSSKDSPKARCTVCNKEHNCKPIK